MEDLLPLVQRAVNDPQLPDPCRTFAVCNTPDGVSRPLSDREKKVLDALLAVQFDGVEALRDDARGVEVVRTCGCGCPSIDFHDQPGVGMHIRVNASIAGTDDGLYLYTVGGRLGGIEYVGVSDEGDPTELPDPARLVITPASPGH